MLGHIMQSNLRVISGRNREDLQRKGSEPGLVTQGALTLLETHTHTHLHRYTHRPPSFSGNRLELIN